MNIVLTGPMGSGKTEVGMRAARELGRSFFDTDGLIEKCSGATIRELFSKLGEENFRGLERKVVQEVAGKDNLVIATGGGVVLDPENMRRLRRNGVIIALEAPLDVILGRLKKMTGRPIFAAMRNDRKALKRYLDARSEYYSNSDFTIDTGRLALQDVVRNVCAIAMRRFVRICGCISGPSAEADIRSAVRNGVSMVELRLDLIPEPDVEGLVRMCPVPVIATDRKNKERLKSAINAGCDFVDIETDSPQKDGLIRLARKKGCRVIASFHDFDSAPKRFPGKGKADLLKIAVKVNSKEELRRLVWLHAGREDLIVVGMGALGTQLRVLAPLLGSYLTYCRIGKATAPGQLGLKEMIARYRELGLR